MDTYCVKVVLTAEDIYNELSADARRRFNRLIIADVTRDREMNLEITCVAVNDCPVADTTQTTGHAEQSDLLLAT